MGLGRIWQWLAVVAGLLSSAAGAQDSASASPQAVADAPYDAEVFARLPLLSTPKLSPDGERILFSTRRNGNLFVVFRELSNQDLHPVSVPDKMDLNWYRWAGNNRILVSVSQTVPWFGDEARKSYLMSIDTTTMKIEFIGKASQGLEGDDLLYVDPSGDWALLSIQRTPYDYPSVFKARLDTGRLTEIQSPSNSIWEWYADNTGVVRVGVSYRARNWTLHYRSSDQGGFKKLATISYDDEQRAGLIEGIRVIGGSDEGYILAAPQNGRYALHRYNYATQAVGERIFGHDQNDIADFDMNADGTVSAAYFTDDRMRVHWFDPAQQEMHRNVEKALGTKHGQLVSRSRDGTVKLYHVGASNDPGSYYIFRESTGVMSVLVRINSDLKPARLSPSTYVSYKTRDGLTIHGNLTLPIGREAKGLPLIILPHGGPYGIRDSIGYEVEVQFLASRGYAVLQPNYRGSGGYGDAHIKAGEGAIGRRMQDDLDDGMDWLVQEGIVDAKRVCMVGSSYGGYAALWAVTRNPERYRCAASFAGVTDWKRMLKYDAKFLSRSGLRRFRNKVQGEESFDLDAVSPLAQAQRLERPVLVAQGEDDTNVPPKQAKLYVAALKTHRKDVEYVSYKDEGHGLDDPANLTDWLKRLEAFLARHNPA
ncbi:alpha/beta hydrolase family protein [Blastomonas aquatica]|uniref:Peptidase n=1 Tax=Blastomonas aquatica TaxID=1510276 RepID=A0ABQ1J938_9SPHN|nr:peptidase [Blastomonas aquatica]